VLSRVELELSKLREVYESSLHATGLIHQINFNVIFIAYNGSRFDFMPIFRCLDDQGYTYDSGTPVAASGKLTSFRFFSQFRNVRDLWGLQQSGGWLTRLTVRFGVWDPNCFVTGSLRSVLQAFRIPLQKLDFDHEAIQRAFTRGKAKSSVWVNYLTDITSQLIEYNTRDVTALAELVSELERVFRVEAGVKDLEASPTLSSLAYGVLKKSPVLQLEGGGTGIDIDTSEERFDLGRVPARSENIRKAMEADVKKVMTFSDSLSPMTDSMDLFVRQGIIAGRVSSGAGMMKALDTA
jgi:hypothetical protein